MKKLIIIATALFVSTSAAQSETFEVLSPEVIDIGVGRSFSHYYVRLMSMPTDTCKNGQILIRMRPLGSESKYNLLLRNYANEEYIPYLKFSQKAPGYRCWLQEIAEEKEEEKEEWSINDVVLSPYIEERRFLASGCPDPIQPGSLGYEYRTRPVGSLKWGLLRGGRMYQVEGDECESGPFDLLVRDDEEVKWRVGYKDGTSTDWKEIIR